MILQWVQFGHPIHRVDQQKAAWFESDFCVNCASYITTILMIDNGSYLSSNCCRNVANVTTPLL